MNDQGIGVLVVTFVLAQIGLFLEQRRRSNKTDDKIDERSNTTDDKIDVASASADVAAVEAASAAQYAFPVSNGFTGKVLSGLARLSAQMDALITEQREDRRRLNEHIGDHASADVRRGI